MKYFLRTLKLFICTTYVCCIGAYAQPKTLKIIVDRSPIGKACERVVEEALSLAGYRLERLLLPPNRAIKEANDGRLADGTICRIPEFYKQYTNMLRVDPGIVPMRSHVFSKGEKIAVTTDNWYALQQYFIATINGHLYSTIATLEFPRVHRVKNSEKALHLLQHNRLDAAVLISINTVRSLQNNPAYRDIKMSDAPITDIPLHFYLHKKNSALLPEIGRAFEQIVSSGRAAQIYREVYNSEKSAL
ncbi:MAG: substrate-binding periplasmic protein [Pseudomonadales bacterium]